MNFLEKLRSANVRRAPDFGAGDLNSWSLAERGNELAGEVGELCNILKKILRITKRAGIGGPNPFSMDDVEALEKYHDAAREEMGDVVICVSLIAAQMGVDLEDATRAKFNATSAKIGSKVVL